MTETEKKKHESTKKKLKIIGTALIIVGFAFTAVGLIDFFRSTGSFEQPKLFWCAFVGMPLLFAGVGAASFGFKRETTRYLKNEIAPTVNELSEDIKPAIKSVADALRDGNDEGKIICPSCKTENPADGKFCKSCGKLLFKVCKSCGKTIEPDSEFCRFCGKKTD